MIANVLKDCPVRGAILFIYTLHYLLEVNANYRIIY